MSSFVPKVDFSKSYLDQLIQLIYNHHTTFQNLLKNNKHCKKLANWILKKTPLLSDSFFTWPTKCRWILDNMKHFNKCEACGKIIKENISIGGHFHTTCSKQCNAKNKTRRDKASKTMLMKYGNANFCNITKRKQTIKNKIKTDPNYIKNIVKKSKLTKLNRYGNEKYVNLEKRKQTNLKKYGCECTFLDKNIQNKIAKTNKLLYGAENVFASKQIQDKICNNNIEKYGVKYTLQTQQVKNQIRKTNLKKYGCEYIGASQEIRKKIEKTCLEKYGNVCSLRNENIKKLSFAKYFYKNMYFDSAPELALFIYCNDKNIKVIYQPEVFFQYSYEGKTFHYQPDFLINNQLVELKGNQFLNEDGTWKNPYNQNDNGKTEAKHQCILKNKIKILYTNEYQKYLDYVKETYGKSYLKSFKNNNI